MLIVTAKFPRRKTVFAAAALAAACCVLALLGLDPDAVRTASADAPPDPKGVRSAQERIAYLEQWGWQVEEEPLSVQELLIPKQLDDSYREYLTMQQEQGFDLAQYAGKRVKRYTYRVTNYPTGEGEVQADLLIYRGAVIGGEVLSPRLDGFLHGLAYPADG